MYSNYHLDVKYLGKQTYDINNKEIIVAISAQVRNKAKIYTFSLEKLTFVRPLTNVVVFLMSAESFYTFLSTKKILLLN